MPGEEQSAPVGNHQMVEDIEARKICTVYELKTEKKLSLHQLGLVPYCC